MWTRMIIFLAIIGFTLPSQAAQHYLWEAEAQLPVARNRTISWREYGTEPVVGNSREDAERIAREIAFSRLKADHPSSKLEAKDLTILVIERDAAQAVRGGHDCRISMYLTCHAGVLETRPGWTIFNLPITTEEEVHDQLHLRVTVSRPDGTESRLEDNIAVVGKPGGRTLVNGVSFPIYEGTCPPGDTKSIVIKIEHQEPWENDAANVPDPWATVGSFEVQITNDAVGGYQTKWLGREGCNFVIPPTTGPSSVARLRFENRLVPYVASVSSVHKQGAEQAALKAAQERLAADAAFAAQLVSDPRVQVYSGTVTFREPNSPQVIGFGVTYVVSADPTAARHFIARVFPNRSDLQQVASKEAVEEALRREFETRRRTTFLGQYSIDEATLQFQVVPKTGRTMADRIREFQGSPHNSRPMPRTRGPR